MIKKIYTFFLAVGLVLPFMARADAFVPDDIRVAPLMRSKWGQTTHNGQSVNASSSVGKFCFNAQTPGNAPCGCMATAFGQILRYLQFPASYDWGQMPLNTLDGVTENQVKALGALSYGLGLMSGADYSSHVTYITVARLCVSLVEKLGFAQTEIAVFGQGALPYSEEIFRRLVVSNCDAARPLVLSVDTADPMGSANFRHGVVVDGYGYSSGRFCVHLRCGDYGESDGWFFPPSFKIGEYDFASVGEVAYNLLPGERGTIVSGRVIKPDGTPCADADLVLTDSQGSVKTTRTSETGVYAFVVEHPGACSILAKFGDNAGRLEIVCAENVSPKVLVTDSGTELAEAGKQVIGNCCDNDILLVKPPADSGDGEDVIDPSDRIVPPPKISPDGGSVNGSVTVTLSDAEPDAEIFYTLDGSETTSASLRYKGPFTVPVSDLLHVRCRARKSGMTSSDESSAVFLPVLSRVEAPSIVVKTGETPVQPQKGVYSFTGTVSVALSSSTPEATIRYTLDGSEPTTASPVYTGPLAVSDDAVVTARAWRDGWLVSGAVTVKLVYDTKGLPAVGDDWRTPMIICGVEGTRTSDKAYRYTLDEDEKLGNRVDKSGTPLGLNLLHGAYKVMYQYHTAWFRWTAPASGEIKFDLSCPTTLSSLPWRYWVVGAVVYQGDNRTPATRILQTYDNASSDAFFSFEAVEGETYLIGVVALNGLDGSEADAYNDPTACYRLSWAMEEPQYERWDDGLIDISGAYLALSNYVCRYTGLSRRPAVAQVIYKGAVLKEDTDYTSAYVDNVNVGTGTVIVAGCGRYKGAMSTTFSVVSRNLTSGMVAEVADQAWTGRPVTPDVSVSLGKKTFVRGTDFEVIYSDNVDEGLAQVTVVGAGNLSGSVIRTFKIVSGVVVQLGETMSPMTLQELGVNVQLPAKATVKAEGLPKGLKLTGSATAGYRIEGKPTEEMDGETWIAHICVTGADKVSRLYPLSLRVVSATGSASSVSPARVTVPAGLSCGVQVELPVDVDVNSTVTDKGLPAGLKLVKDGGSYVIRGVPTSAGEKLVTFTTKAGKASATSTAAFRIAALPSWLTGTFAGQMGEGSFTLTVGAAGKLSVKAVVDGENWTWSAAGFATKSEEGVFSVSGELASGKLKRPFAFSSTNWTTRLAGITVTNAAVCGTADDVVVTAYRSLWTDKSLTAAVLPSVAGTYTHVTADGELLTLTVDAKGTVKTAGTLVDKRKLSLSSTLQLDDGNDWLTFVWLAPDAKNGLAGFGRWLRLVPRHEEPGVYGDAAYRNGAVTATVVAVTGCAGGGTVTLSPAFGQAAVGKTVTLTAKPDKNSVFVKWVLVGEDGTETACGYDTKLSLTSTGRDQTVRAVFRDKTQVETPRLVFDGDAFAALRVGVNFDQQVSVVNPNGTGDDLVRPVKFTAVNLPAGLKLDATSGRICGVPTKATDKAFSITATSTVDKRKSATAELSRSVAALPDWAQGSYVGNMGEGPFSLTVAATGKISVKAANGGTNWTYSAAGYAWERTDDAGNPVFAVVGDLVAGKQKLPLAICSTNWTVAASALQFSNAAFCGMADCGPVVVYRVPWTDKTMAKTLLPVAGKYAYETAAGETLTLTVDAKGGVKAAGTVQGNRKLSVSSTLVLDEFGILRMVLYLAPNAQKSQPVWYLDLAFPVD